MSCTAAYVGLKLRKTPCLSLFWDDRPELPRPALLAQLPLSLTFSAPSSSAGVAVSALLPTLGMRVLRLRCSGLLKITS